MTMQLPEGKKIILFDGVCNLCDRLVQCVIRHDRKDVFRFVALQSDLGQQILRHIGLDREPVDSIVLYEPGVAYFRKSAAAIEIARGLGGIFDLTSALNIVPAVLRDRIYDWIARNRYRWYGRKDACMVPTPERKAKFL